METTLEFYNVSSLARALMVTDARITKALKSGVITEDGYLNGRKIFCVVNRPVFARALAQQELVKSNVPDLTA